MKVCRLGHVFLIMLVLVCTTLRAQRVIEYEAGMGTRDPINPSIWVLYDNVRATHDGMVLYSDSAWLNTERNDFTAMGNVRIDITDTTTIFGESLYYDGERRIVDIWDDTVMLIDGETTLRTPHVTYDRNTSTASYSEWGHTESGQNDVFSSEGYYNSTTKMLDLYRHVVMHDSSTRIETDTMHYDTRLKIATFVGPTYMYSDSATIYSEHGYYHADSNYALSVRASRVMTDGRSLTGDTLRYWQEHQRGEAYGSVVIVDTANSVICTGDYGESDQRQSMSFVTGRALVRMADEPDSIKTVPDTIYMHADTIRVYNDSMRRLRGVQASHHVKFFRPDVQGMCDSAYYDAVDSLMRIYYEPVLWYDNYQCTSDSIDVRHDSTGVRRADLNGHSLVVQMVDRDKFNQLSGKRSIVHFDSSEPIYADILGNAQMVYYVTETDSAGVEALIGVNAGVGADMRIYFKQRKPDRIVTYGNPDMNTYPLDQLPPELKRLADFKWLPNRRPLKPEDVFVW